jgi:hypothetical protein
VTVKGLPAEACTLSWILMPADDVWAWQPPLALRIEYHGLIAQGTNFNVCGPLCPSSLREANAGTSIGHWRQCTSSRHGMLPARFHMRAFLSLS